MRSFLPVVMLAVLLALPAGAAPEPLLVIPASNSLAEYVQELPPGVSISSDPAKSPDGAPVLRITYDVQDCQFVPLAHVPSRWKWKGWLGLHYTGQICMDESPGWGSLKMRWRFVGHDAWCSSTEPRGSRTEWGETKSFLGLPLRMDLVEVVFGVQVEGKGTLWVRNARVTEESRGAAGVPGWVIGAVGGGFGALIGLWGGIIGYLASKGRAGSFVLRGVVASIVVGFLLLVAGMGLFFADMPYAYWYPCGLFGLIMAGVFGGNLKSLRRRYAAVELNRLNAKDASEGI